MNACGAALFLDSLHSCLVAEDGRSEIQLLKAGDSVTIRARCEGLKGSDLVFSRCAIVR